ncbi:1-acyl-sn-glycerol-3-phosphate acyltransferase, partial [Myxococcota bacterium]|nr:1-acyl-sn-glycerol-3-phosphate acyltransferase [Myxococcota bacterium]
RLIIETAAGDDGAALRALAREHTLIFAPTHVSNLDSPLIGYALDRLGLPPAIYGAGLNLFSSPVMGFFMSRLGAYTVDRRKQHRLYKDVLKDYSIDSLGRRCHSLFFPGGTRCRSGRVEDRVKKGLLGTGIIAWQEGLLQGRPHPEVLVVPVTLSFSLVLEAETLIEDSLEEEGKRRYIITDDEFSEP